MIRYEIKKIFSKSMNKIVLLFLLVMLIIVSILTINRVEYVDENGNITTGISAAGNLREAKNEWSGYLTEDVFVEVHEENMRINNSDEALSDDVTEQDKAYSKKQGILSIVDVINRAFSDYRDYNYYAIDNVSSEEVKKVYETRIATLERWLETGEETFTENQKRFLREQYTNLETPFY